MWIKLRTSIKGLFFPKEILPVGAVISIGGPHGKRLVSEAKAIEVACPGDSDPDDIDALSEKFRRVNGPLWDEGKRSVALPLEPQTVTAIHKASAANLSAPIARLLGSRSSSAWRERQRKNGRTSSRKEVLKLRVDPRAKAQNAMRAVMG